MARREMTEAERPVRAQDGPALHGAIDLLQLQHDALVAVPRRRATGGAADQREAALHHDAQGPVDVDHRETGCKTPEAVSYLAKVWSRRKK